MATHSSILAWKISWTEEPDRLQSMVRWGNLGHKSALWKEETFSQDQLEVGENCKV